jgi:hypothetical protein
MIRIIAALERLLSFLLMIVGGGYSLAALIGFLGAMTQRFQTTDQSEIRTFGHDMRSDAMLFSFAFLFFATGIGIRRSSRQDVNPS